MTFQSKKVSYGPVAKGATSEYRTAQEEAYRYALVVVTAGGETFRFLKDSKDSKDKYAIAAVLLVLWSFESFWSFTSFAPHPPSSSTARASRKSWVSCPSVKLS